jgi:hypothetical protein
MCAHREGRKPAAKDAGKMEAVQEALEVLRGAGIEAWVSRMYGSVAEVVIYLPGVEARWWDKPSPPSPLPLTGEGGRDG